jgi:Uma2 family endonuclease
MRSMTAALRQPRMTRDEFLDWAATQEGRWEFGGAEPVKMTGETLNHSRTASNIIVALGSRLRAGPYEVLGLNAGLAVAGDGVRYPDALVTCTPGPGTDRLIPGVVVVFEVVSPSTNRADRIVKLGEYRSVPSIRRYVIVEHGIAALTSLERRGPEEPWTATGLTEAETLDMPEIGIGAGGGVLRGRPGERVRRRMSFSPPETYGILPRLIFDACKNSSIGARGHPHSLFQFCFEFRVV